MHQKSNQSRVWLFRLLIAMPLLALAGIGANMFFSNEATILSEFVPSDADIPPIRLVEDASTDGLDVFSIENHMGGGYALHATTTRNEDSPFVNEEGLIGFNNSLNLNAKQDVVYVIFDNILPDLGRFENPLPVRENFILKVFYDFKEIEFKVSNQQSFNTEFLFNLVGGYQIHIPIQLPETIETTNEWGNLTVAIFATPHYNTINPLAEWYHYCEICPSGFSLDGHADSIVSNFALSIGENVDPLLDEQEGEVNETYLVLSVNPEFLILYEQSIDLLTSVPPSPWTVLQGEEVKIGFAASNISEFPDDVEVVKMNDFVIIGLLNWNQIKLSGMSYFLERSANGIDTNEIVEGYFTIIAPDEPGYYDFVVFAIADSNEPNNFQHGATATRFTLKVE